MKALPPEVWDVIKFADVPCKQQEGDLPMKIVSYIRRQ
jgi:hypothetical protein